MAILNGRPDERASPTSAASWSATITGSTQTPLSARGGPPERTVMLTPPGTVGAVDVRGGAPGTRETDLLDPANSVRYVDAVVLTGGSAYGLAAADGVMRWLEEHDRGVVMDGGVVPIVPAAVIFDLPVGGWDCRPTAEFGYTAAAKTPATMVGRRDRRRGGGRSRRRPQGRCGNGVDGP